MSDREDNESPTSEVGYQRAEKPLNSEELWRQLIEKQNQNMMALISTLQPHGSSRHFTLPEFNPDKVEIDARSWCATVDICFEDNPPRGGQLIVVISSALKGTASSWLSQISYPGISWPEFKDLFTARFISTDTCAGTLINLHNEKLKENESLAACASRIITSLMSRWKDCTKEQIAVATALAHVSQHDSRLQRLAFTTEITSRQQLQKELQAFSYQKRKAVSSEASLSLDNKRAKYYKQPTIKCFGCGKLGHRQAECRSKPINYKPRSPVKSDVTSTSHHVEKPSSIRCFKCGALGHVASHCTAESGTRSGSTSASTPAERRIDLCVVEPPTGYLQHRGGGCYFPDSWTGGWFQSGMPALTYINSTTMMGKGDCAETDGYDKYMVYEKNDDCYRCLVIHEKHKYVLQYKETYCGQRDSLSTMCEAIPGDAALFSMFKKDPRPEPQQCPFHPAPFTFTYSRGSGDCANPPSRAESCTDDSRLLLRYMACPDVPGTESNVEELICLATWKEGSTRYLVGLISQVQRRNTISSDEDMYRCFIYKGSHADKTVTYSIAQSGDATCNGLTSPVDGSRTMKLTNIDDEHNRCHFPNWIVEHHKWYSLDHTHQYHFTTKNATLKIEKKDGTREEKRIVCHSILEQKEKKYVKLVAHLTRGCESGHVCVRVSRRGGGVLELQLGAALTGAPQAACAHDLPATPHVTLISNQLSPSRCPMLGRYTVVDSLADRRRRRQQLTIDETGLEGTAEKPPECVMGQYDTASIGCGASQDTIEFQSACTSTVYTCYGSWHEGSRGLVVAAPASARSQSRPHALCFIYTTNVKNDSMGVPVHYLSVSVVSRSCERSVAPGVAGDKAYNLTINGTCEQSSKYGSGAQALAPAAAVLALAVLLARS